MGRERRTVPALSHGAPRAQPATPQNPACQVWHPGCSLWSRLRHKEARVDENEHPKGALLFMLIYLVTLSALWLNAYLTLWRS